MATIDEINHLYSTQLGGAKPTAADYAYWQNSGLSGDNLYNTFQNAAKSDPRYGTTGVGTGTGATPGGLGGGGSTPAPQFDMNQITGAINGALEGAVGGLGTKIDGGFTTTNNNINTGFDTTNKNLQTGFTGVNNNLQTGFNTIGNGLNQLNTNTATGFQSLNKANDDRALAQSNQATDYFNQLKGLSGGLKDQITGLGTNMNTYYTDLAKTGAGIQSAVDTVGSDLGNFQNDYTRRTNLADQKRSEILDSVAGTAANNRQAMTQGFNQVGAQIAGLGGHPYGGQPQQGVAPQGGAPQGGGQQAPQQGNFQLALNNARGVVGNPQGNNPALVSQLSEFVSAFDANGQLIQQGPDAQGVPTFRNMGPDGILQIAKQGPQGVQFVGGLNVNQIVQMLGGQ